MPTVTPEMTASVQAGAKSTLKHIITRSDNEAVALKAFCTSLPKGSAQRELLETIASDLRYVSDYLSGKRR